MKRSLKKGMLALGLGLSVVCSKGCGFEKYKEISDNKENILVIDNDCKAEEKFSFPPKKVFLEKGVLYSIDNLYTQNPPGSWWRGIKIKDIDAEQRKVNFEMLKNIDVGIYSSPVPSTEVQVGIVEESFLKMVTTQTFKECDVISGSPFDGYKVHSVETTGVVFLRPGYPELSWPYGSTTSTRIRAGERVLVEAEKIGIRVPPGGSYYGELESEVTAEAFLSFWEDQSSTKVTITTEFTPALPFQIDNYGPPFLTFYPFVFSIHARYILNYNPQNREITFLPGFLYDLHLYIDSEYPEFSINTADIGYNTTMYVGSEEKHLKVILKECSSNSATISFAQEGTEILRVEVSRGDLIEVRDLEGYRIYILTTGSGILENGDCVFTGGYSFDAPSGLIDGKQFFNIEGSEVNIEFVSDGVSSISITRDNPKKPNP